MIAIIRSVIILWIFTCSAIVSYGQTYNISNYNFDDGLAQNRVNCLFQDGNGMIWFGTDGNGVSRYDGETFTTFNKARGFPDNTIKVIYEDSQGYLLFGSSSGVIKYNGHSFEKIMGEIQVNAIIEDSLNSYWIGSNNGLLKNTGGTLIREENVESLKNKIINDLVIYREGVLIATDNGVYFLNKDGDLRTFGSSSIPTNAHITDISGSESDILWLSTQQQGLYRIFKELVEKVDLGQPIQIVSIVPFGDEKVAIASSQRGLFIYNYVYESLDVLTESSGLANDRLSSVMKDRWGNIWAATLGNGVSKFSGENILKIGSNFGLPENTINTIFASPSGNVWFSHSSTKLGRFNGNNFFIYDQTLGFPSVKVSRIFEDKGGNLWIGTEDGRLIIKDNNGFREVSLPVDLLGITDIVSDSKGSLWISGKENGIVKFDFNTSLTPVFSHFSKEYGLAENKLKDLQADQNAGMWVLTDSKGLNYISPKGSISELKVEDGLITNSIKSILLDVNDCLWLVYESGGIASITNQKKIDIQNFHLEGTIPNLDIQHILHDGEYLILIHKNGMDLFNIKPSCQIEFDRQISFSHNQIDLIDNPHSIDASNNLIWLGTRGGIFRVSPNAISKENLSAKVSLSKVNLLYDDLYETKYRDQLLSRYATKDPLVFENRENNIGFEFNSAIANNEEFYYQWRLEGHEEEWSPPNRNNSVSYSNLSYGNYRFEVKVVSGNLESFAAPFEFSIKKALYQQLWFLISAGILFLGLILMTYKLRTNYIRKKLKEKQNILEAKLTLLDLEQKALQLQMNPHFIFNSLNAIQALIVKKDLGLARKQIHSFSDLMRSFLNYSRAESITLAEEIEMLENYLHIEQMTRGNKFDYEIYTKITDTEDIKIPPMMTQVFVENAILHGINHLDKRGKVKVEFEEIGNKIRCIIDDNGIGRKAASLKKSSIHESTATKVIIDRLNIFHRNSQLDVFKIVDKMDVMQQPLGTRVEILLPILNGE